MSTSSKGIDFEREVKHFFERRGFTVFRQAKSACPDLIAKKVLSDKTTLELFIECKIGLPDHANYLSHHEKRLLLDYQERFGTVPLHAKRVKENGKYGPLVLVLIDNKK